MDIKLIIQTGARMGQQIPIDTHEFLIGRDADCHHQIDHTMVAPRHARIHLFGGRVSITDLKTENGTAVNDKYVGTVELYNGDRIKVGPTNFLIAIDDQPKDLDRRVEFWVANTLEARGKVVIESAALDALEDAKEKPAEAARKILGKLTSREGTVGGRARLRIGESRGITVVKFVDNALVQDTDIHEVEQELIDLVDSGRRRIVMNFGNVENMSSQVASILTHVHQLCLDRGGLLRICRLGPKVASVFGMLGLKDVLEIYHDERPALEADWPRGTGAEPALRDLAIDPLDEVPADFMPSPGSSLLLAAPPAAAPPAPAPAAAARRPAVARVGLVVEGGKADGKLVEIRVGRFFIGSDSICHLRPKSSLVGPMHAVIERREGRVYVRDLGPAVGTIVGDRTLHGQEAEVADGDRLQIGPLAFRFAVAFEPDPAASRAVARPPAAAQFAPPAAAEANTVDDLAASWLMESPFPGADVAAEVQKRLAKFAAVAPPAAPAPAPATFPLADEDEEDEDSEEIPEAPEPPRPPARAAEIKPPALVYIDAEILQDVLVIRLLKDDLNDEGTVAPIRAELQILFDMDFPRRVVLNLEQVRYLSSRAVGMLLAYHQRLERAGGKLRLCHISPRVRGILEQMRLTMLVEVHPTLDEAILQAW